MADQAGNRAADGAERHLIQVTSRRQGLPLSRALAVGGGQRARVHDFLVYSYFAIQIGRVFFPPVRRRRRRLLLSLATFGVGFLTRPLGAIVIGSYGDRAGAGRRWCSHSR